MKANIYLSLFFSSPVPCCWSCSLSSWVGQRNSWWTLHKAICSETWSIHTQWLLHRMGFLCCAWRNIVIISVLFVICTSGEVHIKWWCSGWNFRWKKNHLLNLAQHCRNPDFNDLLCVHSTCRFMSSLFSSNWQAVVQDLQWDDCNECNFF